MDRELLKILNSEYDIINSTILDIEKEVLPFEEIFTNIKFAYEQSQKKDVDIQFKSILVKTKKLNKTVKEYENKIQKNTNKDIKRIFILRIKILKQKYAVLLKRIVSVNENYNSYNKNVNKFSFIKNDEPGEPEEKYNSEQHSDMSTAQVMVNVKTIANDQVTNAYQNTISRNAEVERLANDVRELFEMFQDFAVLVNAQHEDIISIENTIEDAQKKIDSGNKKLVGAIDFQRKARKKSCCIACISIVILIIIVSVAGGISAKFV